MAENGPDTVHNDLKKKNNPFKKILDNVKKFIKKDGAEDKKPSSLEVSKKETKIQNKKSHSSEAPIKEKKTEGKKPHNTAATKKEKKEIDKKPTSFKESKKEKNPELNQQQENSSFPRVETPETKEAERSMRERKGKIKEQKLPKKYRKGW